LRLRPALRYGVRWSPVQRALALRRSLARLACRAIACVAGYRVVAPLRRRYRLQASAFTLWVLPDRTGPMATGVVAPRSIAASANRLRQRRSQYSRVRRKARPTTVAETRSLRSDPTSACSRISSPESRCRRVHLTGAGVV
jgi:hypothetical protein